MASLPFLSHKFFAKQKTYGIIAAGLHASPLRGFGFAEFARSANSGNNRVL
jgi:hypothetical protein